MEAYFDVADGVFLPSAWVAGPWSSQMQHGGAPAGLLAGAVKQIPTLSPMRLARITIELLKPVPLAPLILRTKVVKDGWKTQVCDLELAAEDVVVARASALRIRDSDPSQAPATSGHPLDLPGPHASTPCAGGTHLESPFIEGLETRVAGGMLDGPEPAAVWYRLSRPILPAAPLSGDIRAAVAADFVNGTAALLDPAAWIFLNCDVTLNLARTPVGEWVLVNAQGLVGPRGVGLATARLGDEDGYFGHAALSLVIDPQEGLNS